MSEMSKQQMQEQLDALNERVAGLEAQLAALLKDQGVPEEDLILIGAAVAAYFGHKAKVRAVRFRRQTSWAAASRERVHDRSVPHIR